MTNQARDISIQESLRCGMFNLNIDVVRMSKVSLSILPEECGEHTSPFIGSRVRKSDCSDRSTGYIPEHVREQRTKRTTRQLSKLAHTNIKFNRICGNIYKNFEVPFVKKHATDKTSHRKNTVFNAVLQTIGRIIHLVPAFMQNSTCFGRTAPSSGHHNDSHKLLYCTVVLYNP
jgi:hypothetical protein